MESCIKRQTTTIKSSYQIGEHTIDLEQRLLTKVEVDNFKKLTEDITSDYDIFSALIESEKFIKAKELSKGKNDDELGTDILYTLNKATKKTEEKLVANKLWLIVKSLSTNILYGGYCKFDDKKITIQFRDENTKEDEVTIDDIIGMLESEIFDELHKNVEKLMNPSKEEVTEVKP